MVISIMLESKGFEVDSLNDQVLALSNFQSEHYDLAIHDIIMPEMDGFELYNQIKKLDSHVMACFLTASDRVYSNSKTTNSNKVSRRAGTDYQDSYKPKDIGAS
jgi:CheY-like chemotaxis protein